MIHFGYNRDPSTDKIRLKSFYNPFIRPGDDSITPNLAVYPRYEPIAATRYLQFMNNAKPVTGHQQRSKCSALEAVKPIKGLSGLIR